MIKSNNPHLAGGETFFLIFLHIYFIYCPFLVLLEHSPRMVAVRGCESELALLTSGFCKFACLAKTFNLRSSNALCRYKSPRSLRSLAQLYKDRYQPPLPCAARALIAQGCSERLSAWVGAFDKWLLQFCFFGKNVQFALLEGMYFFEGEPQSCSG